MCGRGTVLPNYNVLALGKLANYKVETEIDI